MHTHKAQALYEQPSYEHLDDLVEELPTGSVVHISHDITYAYAYAYKY